MEIFIITLSITLCVCLFIYCAKFFEKNEEDFFADYVTKTIKKPTTVPCEYCRCEIEEKNAYKVESMHLYYGDLYYCNKCKPNYDKIGIDFDGIKHYYKQLEVTKDGEPVGYKKK